MKRYYVNDEFGMPTDAQFIKIRDEMAREKLLIPGEEREHRRRRWPDGRVTDQAYLYLWRKREAAEEFLTRLSGRHPADRWMVFEVDVEGSLGEILDPEALPLPDAPRVVSIRYQPYVDHTGEEALRVYVTLEDKPSGGLYAWSELSAIDQTIHNTLATEGINLYPYVEFSTASKAVEQGQDA